MTVFLQDLVYAFRQVRKTPGFTTTVILTLALGIGANAAIFTLVNAVLLRNLPVVDPKTLIRVGDTDDCCVNSGWNDKGDYSLFSTDSYLLMKKNVPEFQELAAMEAGFDYRPLTARHEDPQSVAKSIMGEFVSGNYFRTFGLQPAAGRFFTDGDDTKGAAFTAVMSYDTWAHDYAADPSIIGTTFRVNTQPVTIIGVAPKGYYGDRLTSTPPNFYLPIESMAVIANVPYLHDPETEWVYVIGRVKPGVSLPAVQSKISTLLRQEFSTFKMFSDARGKTFLDRTHVVLIPGGAGIQQLQDNAKSQLHLLSWIAALVLLVACANIANLQLVRSMGRRSEMCVRTALGAQRSRIIRQLLTESILLAGLGGIAGLAVAYAGAHMLLAMAFPGAQNVPIDATPSLLVILFAFGLSLLTGILFGVAPAWIAAQAQPADALRSGTRTTAGGASLLQRSLVILQASLSLVLLVGAGLFAQSLNKLESSDMHLDSKNRYIIHFNPQAAGYATTQVEALYRTIEDHFHALPGVVKVGISTYTPMEDNNWSNSVQIQGEPDPNKGASWVKGNADYFDSVGTHVLMGRGFKPQDLLAAPPIAVVNQQFVKTFFKPGQNPIGHRVGSPGPEGQGKYEIVGVVEDTTYTAVQWKDHAMYFVPITQRPANTKTPISEDIGLYAGAIILQTSRPMNDMEKLAQRTLSGINPNLTIVKFQTFDQQIADRFNDGRMIAQLTSLFGALALLLATIGLYGVTSYTVVRRTPEIGIRMALGAERIRVVGMVMRGAMLQAVIRLAIGAPIAILCVRYIKSQLYEITRVDTGVLVGAICILTVAAAVAGMIPARRAASINPVKALRVE
ncbi:MAG TPA: ABC transporter permease [Terracidiphilus sp.]|nr:ABC transporter permease [Terracidiphilus sp.]